MLFFDYKNTSYFTENIAFEKGKEGDDSSLPAELLSCGHREAAIFTDYFCDGQDVAIASTIWQYTLSGKGILEYEGKPAMELVPGTLMLLAAPHDYWYFPADKSEGWEFIYVCMKGDSAINIIRKLIEQHGPVNAFPEESSAVALARELLGQANEKLISSRWMASKLAYDLIMETARELTMPKDQLPPFVHRAFEYCASHADSPLTVGDLAKASGYSQYHFVRQFKKHVGMAPSDYIREVRLNRAHKLLQVTPASVKEIADACGFVSVSHFSRAFSKRFGFPPGKIRKRPMG